MNDIYTGYQCFTLDENQLAGFYDGTGYSKEHITNNLVENEYALIKDSNGTIVDKYKKTNGILKKINFQTIESHFGGKLKPRNPEQELAIDMLHDKTTIKLITGSWGTGKDCLQSAAAIELIEKGEFDKIYWVRNNVQVKDTDQIGALPGDAFDKMLPYLGPFMDHVGGQEGVISMIEDKKLEVIPLGFMRGRSLRNSIIMCSEAENLTKEHIQLLIARVDEGSNIWLNADNRQRDRASFERSKGIETMIERLKGQELFGYVHLTKSERSKTAALADLLND